MIRIDDDAWGREVWFESDGLTDTYTVILSGVTCFTVVYPVGTLTEHAYNTINDMLWQP